LHESAEDLFCRVAALRKARAKNSDCVLQYEEKFAAVFTAVNMHVTEVYAQLVCFKSYVCPETLGNGCFSRANVSCHDNPLGHSLWKTQQEIEKFHQQTVFFLSVRQSARDVVDVELCLIFKHALMGLHGLNLKLITFRAVLFFSLER
jgi:hypothetical protein